LRQRHGVEHYFPLIRSLEHQSNGKHQDCFHLCDPLIVAALFTIRQSKNDSSAIPEPTEWEHIGNQVDENSA